MSSHTHINLGLHIKAITPVIGALFGWLSPDLKVDHTGVATLHISAVRRLSWNELRDRLLSLLPADRQEQITDVADTGEVLWALAAEFRQDSNYALSSFIEHYIDGGADTADLSDLYFLAECFDDGHSLSKMSSQRSWDGGSPSSSCGGEAGLNSNKLAFRSTTHGELALAQRLDECLQANDLDQAAQHMVAHFYWVASGFSDTFAREAVAFSTACQLLTRFNHNGRLPLSTLYRLWDELGNVPCSEAAVHEVRNGIRENEQLTRQRFLLFPEGTAVEAIWRWFESMDHRFVVGDVMQGKRLPDDAKG